MEKKYGVHILTVTSPRRAGNNLMNTNDIWKYFLSFVKSHFLCDSEREIETKVLYLFYIYVLLH